MYEYALEKKEQRNLRKKDRKVDLGRYALSYHDRKQNLTQLELLSDDLEVVDTLTNPVNARQHVEFQYDPERVVRLAKVLRQLSEVRRRIKEILRRISKSEFRRVKYRNTKWTRGWIRVKPARQVRTLVPEQYSWELVWTKTVYLTTYQLYKRLLISETKEAKRKSYRKWISWFEARPKVLAMLKPVHPWREDPVWIKHVVLPAGALGSYNAPVKEYKAFPIVNWANVHQQWARRLKSVRKELVSLRKKQRDLQDAVARLQPATSDYNAMLHEQDMIPIVDRGPSDIRAQGLPRRNYYPTWGGYEFELSGGASSGVSEDYTSHFVFTTERERWDAWRTNPEFWDHLPTDADETYTESPAMSRQEYPTFFWEGPSGSSESLQIGKPRPVCLDDVEAMVKDFEDQRALALASLRNLNLRRDEVEFNWFRSLGELKDTPQTVRAGKEFFTFCKSSPGRQYIEVMSTRGRRHYLDLASLSSSQAAVLNLKRHPLTGKVPSTRLKGKALRAAGWRSCKVRTISKATPMKILASVYLSWKFAVAPTIGDVDTCVSNGREYVFALRRGLGQLVRDHDVHFWASRSLRRNFMRTDIPVRGLNWRKPGATAIDGRPSLYEADQDEGNIMFSDGSAEQIAMLFTGRLHGNYLIPGTDDVFVYRYEKLDLWLPATGSSSRGALDEEEYYRIISNHNLEVKAKMLEVCSPVVCWAQLLSGTNFAKFTARDLQKALGLTQTTLKEALGLQVTKLNLYQTVWELLPCSFVVEWFTNLGTCAQACNNVMNCVLTDLKPNKAAWNTLKTQVWASQAAPRDCSITLEATPIWGYGIEYLEWSMGGSSFLYQRHAQRFPLGIHVKYSFEATTAPHAGILRRTAMCRVVRKPVKAGLSMIPKPRLRVSITPPQAGSLAAMLLSAL